MFLDADVWLCTISTPCSLGGNAKKCCETETTHRTSNQSTMKKSKFLVCLKDIESDVEGRNFSCLMSVTSAVKGKKFT